MHNAFGFRFHILRIQDLYEPGTKTFTKVFSKKISGRTFYKIEANNILVGDIFFVSDIDFHKIPLQYIPSIIAEGKGEHLSYMNMGRYAMAVEGP
jgi:hypothetical protein